MEKSAAHFHGFKLPLNLKSGLKQTNAFKRVGVNNE